MCGARSPAGAAREKWPCASLFVLPISCMPCDSERRVTSSPAEGLPVVALVTVPVMLWAAAKDVSRSTQKRSMVEAPEFMRGKERFSASEKALGQLMPGLPSSERFLDAGCHA